MIFDMNWVGSECQKSLQKFALLEFHAIQVRAGCVTPARRAAAAQPGAAAGASRLECEMNLHGTLYGWLGSLKGCIKAKKKTSRKNDSRSCFV